MRIREIIDSFNYAFEGLLYVFWTQRNMRIHFLAAFLILTLSLFSSITRLELLVLFLTISLVLVMEMVNTAVEKVVDLYTGRYNPLAKIAKNVAAGAVLVSAVNAIIVGYLIFLEQLSPLTLDLFFRIRQVPSHYTFILLIMVILVIIAVKSMEQEEKRHFLRGGMPSGHAALSFAIAMIISFLVNNALVIFLVFILAILVMQSRLEAGIHTLYELIAGALLGLLITVIFFQFIG